MFLKRRNLNSAKVFANFPCRILAVHISPIRTWELNSLHPQSPTWMEDTYDGELPGAPKESFAALLSLPQCHAAFGTMSHTLASVDQSPVCRPRTLPLCDENAKGWILEGYCKISHFCVVYGSEIVSLLSTELVAAACTTGLFCSSFAIFANGWQHNTCVTRRLRCQLQHWVTDLLQSAQKTPWYLQPPRHRRLLTLSLINKWSLVHYHCSTHHGNEPGSLASWLLIRGREEFWVVISFGPPATQQQLMMVMMIMIIIIYWSWRSSVSIFDYRLDRSLIPGKSKGLFF
jgi:hypothetical protein